MEVNLIHHNYNVERRKMYPSNRIVCSMQPGTTSSAKSISHGRSLWKNKNSISIINLKSEKCIKNNISIMSIIELWRLWWKSKAKWIEIPSESCPSIPSKPEHPGQEWQIHSPTRSKHSNREDHHHTGRKAGMQAKYQKTIFWTKLQRKISPFKTVQAYPQQSSATT